MLCSILVKAERNSHTISHIINPPLVMKKIVNWSKMPNMINKRSNNILHRNRSPMDMYEEKRLTLSHSISHKVGGVW